MNERAVTAKKAVQRLADAGLRLFTIDDLVDQTGLDRRAATHLAYRMARAGLTRRLRRGRYALLEPADWEQETFLTNWYLAAAHLVAPGPYYLAYYTAMELHQMLQHPLRTVFVAVPRARALVTLGTTRIRFVTVKRERLFGFEERQVEAGRAVNVADLERTFLDAVDRPDLCGGIEEVFRGFARRHRDLNGDRLLKYVGRFDRPAVTKRLGFLLEAAGVGDPELLWEIERLAGRTRHYYPLVKGQEVEGADRNKRWELLINTDLQKLLRAART
ncbi:MAG: hypothetical protein M3Q23_00905 [Actinomycetota bacterium]|nr:hypothetical protein [Actinomycetota bacterium]